MYMVGSTQIFQSSLVPSPSVPHSEVHTVRLRHALDQCYMRVRVCKVLVGAHLSPTNHGTRGDGKILLGRAKIPNIKSQLNPIPLTL